MDYETAKALGVVALVTFVWWLIGRYQIHRDRMRAPREIAPGDCTCYGCASRRANDAYIRMCMKRDRSQ